MSIELTEFARRLCAANHPMFATTGARVPCGQHVQEAQRLWGLTQRSGTASFRVLVEAREQEVGDQPAEVEA